MTAKTRFRETPRNSKQAEQATTTAGPGGPCHVRGQSESKDREARSLQSTRGPGLGGLPGTFASDSVPTPMQHHCVLPGKATLAPQHARLDKAQTVDIRALPTSRTGVWATVLSPRQRKGKAAALTGIHACSLLPKAFTARVPRTLVLFLMGREAPAHPQPGSSPQGSSTGSRLCRGCGQHEQAPAPARPQRPLKSLLGVSHSWEGQSSRKENHRNWSVQSPGDTWIK